MLPKDEMRHDKEHRLKTYTALEQVGCTLADEILVIANALPINAKIIYPVGSRTALGCKEIYPVDWITVTIEKFSNNFYKAEAEQVTSSEKWFGAGETGATNFWAGWVRNFSTNGGNILGKSFGLNDGMFSITNPPSYVDINLFNEVNVEEGKRFLRLYNKATVGLASAFRFCQVDDGTTKQYSLFGEHNKPSGTYTGNGDATERTINIGGIGKSLLIWGDNKYTFLFVTSGGAFRIGSDMHPKYIPYGELDFVGGILRIKSTDQYFNESGTNYNYVVL